MKIQLLNNESVVRHSPIHWKNVLIPAALLALCLFIVGYKSYYRDESVFTLIPTGNLSPEVVSDLSVLETGLCLLAAFIALVYLAVTSSRHYYLTNLRIIVSTGLIRRKVTEMFIDKCETVTLDQILLDRMLDSGDITCTGAGTELTLESVMKAGAFKRDIVEQLSHTEIKA